MSYTINNFSVTYPVGSICPYGGSSDPNGWIICNSTERDWHTKYQSLIDMSIGTKNGLKYTPPDLRKYTMSGTNTAANLKTSVGNVDNSHNITVVPRHTHSAPNVTHNSITNHTHTHSDWYMGADAAEPYGNSQQADGGDREDIDGAIADMSANRTTTSNTHSHASSFSNFTGSGTPVNILNRCYIINWIVKY
jgi:microcystin-dependent protein